MILKNKDSLAPALARMEGALKGELRDFERRRMKKKLAQMRSGIRGEGEAAYYIDFHLKDSSNWIVIHDLRIEWKGRVAQIDHLILGRCLEAYVVESKNYGTKVRHANGGWERLVYNDWEGIACPVEQNERHILVLKQLIEERGLAPIRLGIPLPLRYVNVVLVAPTCSIVGKFPPNVRIYRMDKLIEQISKVEGSPLSLLKVVSPETLLDLGNKLGAQHAPATVNAPALEKATNCQPRAVAGNPGGKCESCGGVITIAETNFCRSYKNRFAGKALCQKCQKFAPKIVASNETAPCCENCGTKVYDRVVKYCEGNAKLFGNQILCRKCQDLIRAAA